MKILLTISLLLSQLQLQSNERKIAIFLDPDKPIIMKESSAKNLLSLLKESEAKDSIWNKKSIAAIEAALMIKSHHCDHTPTDNEVKCFDK